MNADRPPLALHIIHGLTLGGAEMDLLLKLTWVMHQREHEVTVACLMRRGELAERFEAAGARVVGPFMRHRYDAAAAGPLVRLLRSRPWSVIHTHLFEASLVLWLATLPRHGALRAPWIASEHSMPELWGNPALRMDRRFLRTARCMTVPTEAARAGYVERGIPPTALRVLPIAVDTERLDTVDRPSARHRLRRDLAIGPDEFVVGTVSRLHAVKALDSLVAAVAPLGVRLLLVGEGAERERLENAIRDRGAGDRIRLLGSRTDIPDLLCAFDVLALPSRSESFGLAVAEALAVGTPVIASRTGGIPEITGDGRFARLVPPGNRAALTEAVRWARDHRDEHAAMTDGGREFVRAKWSVPVVTRVMDTLYRETIAGG